MSSSKVFKKPNSFVPEKIISTKKVPSGWNSIAIPAGRKSGFSSVDNEYSKLHRLHSSDNHLVSGIESESESVYKTDFSSPDTALTAGDEPETSTSANDLSTAPSELPDLEKLQEEAYNKGLRDGLKIAEEDFVSSTKALVMACELVNSLRETVLNNSMDEMENLVLAIAEKIIRHSVTEQDRTITDTVAEAIRQAVKSDELIIHVNPADFATINAKSKEFVDAISGLENIVVQANPAIEQGGCSIDSSTSTVDATISSQLQIIEEKIKGKT
jgi:flagellar assembly protein FliH